METQYKLPSRANLEFNLALVGAGLIFLVAYLGLSVFVQDTDLITLIKSVLFSLIFIFLAPPIFFILQKQLNKKTIQRPTIQEYLPLVKRELRVLGISLHDIHKKPENNSFLINRLTDKKLSQTPIKLRFLLLNQNSPFIGEQEKEEDGKISGRIKSECEDTIRALDKMRSYVQQKVIVHSLNFKVVDAMPKHSIIIIDDDRIFLGPYFHQKKGFTTPWMEITDPQICCECKKEFESLWREGKDVVIEKTDDETIRITDNSNDND